MPAYRPGKGAAGPRRARHPTDRWHPTSLLPPIQSIVDAVALAAKGATDGGSPSHRGSRTARIRSTSVPPVTVGAGSVGLLQQLFSPTSTPATRSSTCGDRSRLSLHTQLMAGVDHRPADSGSRIDLGRRRRGLERTKLVPWRLRTTRREPRGRPPIWHLLDGITVPSRSTGISRVPDPALGDPVRDLIPYATSLSPAPSPKRRAWQASAPATPSPTRK